VNLEEDGEMAMKAIKAVYENGKVDLSEEAPGNGPLEVLVVFPEENVSEDGDEAWNKILNDPTPRPKLRSFLEEVKKEVAEGKAKPLRLEDL
jgi:hypothetical protein